MLPNSNKENIDLLSNDMNNFTLANLTIDPANL